MRPTIPQHDLELRFPRLCKSPPDLAAAVRARDAQQHGAVAVDFVVDVGARELEFRHRESVGQSQGMSVCDSRFSCQWNQYDRSNRRDKTSAVGSKRISRQQDVVRETSQELSRREPTSDVYTSIHTNPISHQPPPPLLSDRHPVVRTTASGKPVSQRRKPTPKTAFVLLQNRRKLARRGQGRLRRDADVRSLSPTTSFAAAEGDFRFSIGGGDEGDGEWR